MNPWEREDIFFITQTEPHLAVEVREDADPELVGELLDEDGWPERITVSMGGNLTPIRTTNERRFFALGLATATRHAPTVHEREVFRFLSFPTPSGREGRQDLLILVPGEDPITVGRELPLDDILDLIEKYESEAANRDFDTRDDVVSFICGIPA